MQSRLFTMFGATMATEASKYATKQLQDWARKSEYAARQQQEQGSFATPFLASISRPTTGLRK